MKFVVTRLKLGETVNGLVSELLSGGEMLINIEGDLLRVLNETRESFKAGDSVILVVEAIDPLKFRLQPPAERLRHQGRRVGRLDVSV